MRKTFNSSQKVKLVKIKKEKNMKKRILLTLLVVVALIFALALVSSAAEINYEETATMKDGTVLPIYNESNQGLIWFVYSTDENGVKTYKSVVANNSTADNANSYVTYNINSTYGANQMHEVYINYWNAETSAYESIAQNTIAVFNGRDIQREFWAINASKYNSNLEYVYYPASIRSSGDFTGNTGLQLVDCSLATNFETFPQQSFKDCTSLREFRFGTSETGYEIVSTQYGCTFTGCTSLTTLVFADISKITSIEGGTFQNCYSLTGTYEFSGVTSIGDNAFRDAAKNDGTYLVLKFPNLERLGGNAGDPHVFSYSGLQELYIGDKLSYTGYQTMSSCTKLWKVEIAGVAEGFEFKSYLFYNCSALKAFSIPEGITALPSHFFSGCTSLEAVYLPSTLTAINSGSQGGATFFNCKKMYFVDQPFTITSKDDVIPKPDVYYFPNGLQTITSETFKNCQSLNETLVFPTGVTQITDAYAFEATTSNVTLKNIVFLGDMTKIATSNNAKIWDFTGKIYLANSADKSSADVSFGTNLGGDIVYCWGENNTTHLAEPKKTVTTDPDCVTNIFKTEYCFCGKEIGTTEVADSKLGHNHDLTNGAILLAITYTDYTKDGNKTVKCSRCDVTDETQVASKIILGETGFSAKIEGNGITFGYNLDKEALEELKSVYAGVQFGFVAAVDAYLDGKAPLDASANAITLDKGTVLKADITNEIFENGITRVDFKLVGDIWNASVDLDGEVGS